MGSSASSDKGKLREVLAESEQVLGRTLAGWSINKMDGLDSVAQITMGRDGRISSDDEQRRANALGNQDAGETPKGSSGTNAVKK